MKLFIRLKSNPRYAVILDGLLKDMTVTIDKQRVKVTTMAQAEKVVAIPPNEKGFHILVADGVETQVACSELIAEIKRISETYGISLTHGE